MKKLIALSLSLLALAACKTVKADKMEAAIKDKLAASLPPDSIDSVKCPDGIQAEKNKDFTCNVKFQDASTADVVITITDIDGSDLTYKAEWKGGQTPPFVTSHTKVN